MSAVSINMKDGYLGVWKYRYEASGNLVEVNAPRPETINEEVDSTVVNDFTYDEAGNMTRGKDLTNPGSPSDRLINYNCFNKPKVIYTIAGGRTRKTTLVVF